MEWQNCESSSSISPSSAPVLPHQQQQQVQPQPVPSTLRTLLPGDDKWLVGLVRAEAVTDGIQRDAVDTLLMIDSGAYTHVCPSNFGDWNPIDTSQKSIGLRCANGHEIGHYGRRHVSCYLFGKEKMEITFEFDVCDVKRPILSVHQLCQTGFRITFDRKGAFLSKGPNKLSLISCDGVYFIPVETNRRTWLQNAGLRKSCEPLGQVTENADIVSGRGEGIARASLSSCESMGNHLDKCCRTYNLLSPVERPGGMQIELPEALRLGVEEAIAIDVVRATTPPLTGSSIETVKHSAETVKDVQCRTRNSVEELPTVEVDYIFLSDSESTSSVPILVAVSKTTDHVFATMALAKGKGDLRAIHLLTQFLGEWLEEQSQIEE